MHAADVPHSGSRKLSCPYDKGIEKCSLRIFGGVTSEVHTLTTPVDSGGIRTSKDAVFRGFLPGNARQCLSLYFPAANAGGFSSVVWTCIPTLPKMCRFPVDSRVVDEHFLLNPITH